MLGKILLVLGSNRTDTISASIELFENLTLFWSTLIIFLTLIP